MSDKGAWKTKADVLRDLVQFTGIYDIEEDDFVREKPPLRERFSEIDDEMQYQFRDCEGRPQDSWDSGPDLAGITECLRMVDEYDKAQKNGSGDGAPTATSDEVITISKLNPNVPEFIPVDKLKSSPSIKSNIDLDTTVNLNGVSDSNNVNKQCEKNNASNDCELDERANIKDFNITKKIDISKLNPDEIKDITQKLRNKISSKSNNNNLICKREKNVAIATLLKLYSTTNDTPITVSSAVNESPIKLFTPEYFEKCSATVEDEEDDKQKTKTEDGILKSNIINSPTNCDVNLVEVKKKKISEDVQAELESSDLITDPRFGLHPSTSSTVLTSPVKNIFYENPDVRESIKKVKGWFEKPLEKKVSRGPSAFLGPVMFRKKEKPKSPISDISTPSSSGTTNIAQYRPSDYAENLKKIYIERSKAREIHNMDIWAKAEKEMKEREEKMRKKQNDTSSISTNSQDDSESKDEEELSLIDFNT